MDIQELLSQFSSALTAEIALIEKEGREQTYELLSGHRDEKSTGTLYVFVLADALRLPADASGTLKVEGRDISAMVVSVEGNRIWLLLESVGELPEYLSAARLVLNETDLLKRLKEKIDGMGSDVGLAAEVFGLKPGRAGTASIESAASKRFDPQGLAVIEQCLSSDITYIWGPPGTGKTFTIAGLVASIAELGGSVLVTSHTHAAVEQALRALVQSPSQGRDPGFLHDSPLVDEGKILKVGQHRSEDLPAKVLLDGFLAERSKERDEQLQLLDSERQRLLAESAHARSQLRPWEVLRAAEDNLAGCARSHEATVKARVTFAERVSRARQVVSQGEADRVRAERSFLIGRAGRVQRASIELAQASAGLKAVLAEAGVLEARVLSATQEVGAAEESVRTSQRSTVDLPPESSLMDIVEVSNRKAEELAEEIQALREAAQDDAQRLVKEATAIFATLTKLYVDRNLLVDLKWDTVIVDEVSMVMPPLLAYAASLAKKRLIVVGDMYQIPPVVNSDKDDEGGILATNVFELAHITEAVEAHAALPQLTKLTNQRRMHPDISGCAKVIIKSYDDLTDDPSVLTRPRPGFLNAVEPDAALVVVDTSNLSPWSGKMPGSLSRFNFISGQAAVELAALYANQFNEPDERTAPPIGIVTPYAAQRRYLNKLIQMFDLDRWVMAGTVHTFQGNECDVIIFDSVIGNPHWTSRFTNPANWREVRRDLNVAITRARHQFVFLGDSSWLKRNSRAGTGFGTLWPYLESKSIHLKAEDILGPDFKDRVAKSIPEVKGWDLNSTDKATLLTEADFYGHFAADLESAKDRVILYTPFIGKTRWPQVSPLITALRGRRVEVYLLHKPLTDPEWRLGDPAFGREVFKQLSQLGVQLIPMSGVHAKTIVIDSEIVYEGSLNWASQTASYEHMWRFKSGDMAKLIERMLQLEPIVKAYDHADEDGRCPKCKGPLIVINQTQLSTTDQNPWKLGCARYAENRDSCEGYLRRIDGRAPFLRPPKCPLGAVMKVNRTSTGRPWDWRCGHRQCRSIRWARGDCEC